MTTLCLDDEALLALHLGEAPAADVRHLRDCPQCMRRLGKLRADLAQIDAHLAAPPPRVPRTRSPRALVWAPLGLAATAALAVVLLRPHDAAPPAPATYDPEVIGFLGDVEDALDPLDEYDGADDALDSLGSVDDPDVQGRTGPPAGVAVSRSTVRPGQSFLRVRG